MYRCCKEWGLCSELIAQYNSDSWKHASTLKVNFQNSVWYQTIVCGMGGGGLGEGGGELAQMVKPLLSMQEALGSMPRFSIAFSSSCYFFFFSLSLLVQMFLFFYSILLYSGFTVHLHWKSTACFAYLCVLALMSHSLSVDYGYVVQYSP